MLRSVDGKSFLIGVLVVLVAMCAMAMTGVHLMDGQYNGRFTMIINPTQNDVRDIIITDPVEGAVFYPGNSNVYILDTATGQVWTPEHPDIKTFYAPKLEGYAPEDESIIDPNSALP